MRLIEQKLQQSVTQLAKNVETQLKNIFTFTTGKNEWREDPLYVIEENRFLKALQIPFLEWANIVHRHPLPEAGGIIDFYFRLQNNSPTANIMMVATTSFNQTRPYRGIFHGFYYDCFWGKLFPMPYEECGNLFTGESECIRSGCVWYSAFPGPRCQNKNSAVGLYEGGGG